MLTYVYSQAYLVSHYFILYLIISYRGELSTGYDSMTVSCIMQFVRGRSHGLSGGWHYGTRPCIHIDGLVQDCSNSIANALELLQSCTMRSIWQWLHQREKNEALSWGKMVQSHYQLQTHHTMVCNISECPVIEYLRVFVCDYQLFIAYYINECFIRAVIYKQQS